MSDYRLLVDGVSRRLLVDGISRRLRARPDRRLLVDGVSFRLLVDGTSHRLLAGDTVPAVTLSGPSSGAINVASSNFTATMVYGVASVTFTPAASTGTGSFSPTSVLLTVASPSATFTFTPTSSGARDIQGTNNGGLSGPTPLQYTVVAASIAVTDLSRLVYQRDAGATTKAITFSGTYANGAPSTVEVKIVNEIDDSMAQDWTALSSATIAAGAWSGTLTVPQGGPYNFLARGKAGDGAVMAASTQSSFAWEVGVFVALWGQSNMSRMFELSTSPPTALAGTHMHTTSGYVPLTGNGAITLANLLRTGIGAPIVIMAYAAGATGLLIGGPTYPQWDSLTAGQPYPLFAAGLTATGGDCEFVLWHQGEMDTYPGAVTKAQYKAGLDLIYGRVRTATGRSTSTLKFGCALLGTMDDVDRTDASVNIIRQAHLEWASETTGGFMAGSSVDMPRVDAYHWAAPAYERMARRYAQAILNQLGIVAFGAAGPSISSAIWDGVTQVRVLITHDGGSALEELDGSSDGVGVTGFEVSDDSFSTTETISATAFSGDEVVITLSTTPAATPKVRYQYGEKPPITNPVYDNTNPQGDSIGLPLRPTLADITAALSSNAGSGALVSSVAMAGAGEYIIADAGSGAELVPVSLMEGAASYLGSRVGAGALTDVPVMAGAGVFVGSIFTGTGDLTPESAMDGVGAFSAFVVTGSGDLIPLPVMSGVGSFSVPSGLLSVAISYESYSSPIPAVDVSDVITIEARFTDTVTGIPSDPTGLNFRLRSPAGVITTSAPTRISSGLYAIDVTVTEQGKWRFRFEADGVAGDGQFVAKYSMVH